MRGLRRGSIGQGDGGFCGGAAERTRQGWVVPAVRGAASAVGSSSGSGLGSPPAFARGGEGGEMGRPAELT